MSITKDQKDDVTVGSSRSSSNTNDNNNGSSASTTDDVIGNGDGNAVANKLQSSKKGKGIGVAESKQEENDDHMMMSSFTKILRFMGTKASYRIMMITVNLLLVQRIFNLGYSLTTAGFVYHVFNLQDLTAGAVNIYRPTTFFVVGFEHRHCMYWRWRHSLSDLSVCSLSRVYQLYFSSRHWPDGDKPYGLLIMKQSYTSHFLVISCRRLPEFDKDTKASEI